MQPMDCGIIECFQRMYIKELVETLIPLPHSRTQNDVVSNHKDLIMWDCCRMIQDSWSYIENTEKSVGQAFNGGRRREF
jgi:hypothetical protein